MKNFNEWVCLEMGDAGLSRDMFDKAVRLQLHRMLTWLDENQNGEPYVESLRKKLGEAMSLIDGTVAPANRSDSADFHGSTRSAIGSNWHGT